MTRKKTIRVGFEYVDDRPSMLRRTMFETLEGYHGNPWELADRIAASMVAAGSTMCTAITVHVLAAGKWWWLDRLELKNYCRPEPAGCREVCLVGGDAR